MERLKTRARKTMGRNLSGISSSDDPWKVTNETLNFNSETMKRTSQATG